jgi:hypothetical protein
MAIIKCPECENEISDKAKKCIHCGKVFEEHAIKEENVCAECGTALTEEHEMCPSCGCPVERKNEIKPQPVEVAKINMNKKTKKLILGILVFLLIGIVSGVGYKTYSDYKIKKEYVEAYNSYIDNLKMARILMLDGGSKAETLCNLTIDVWGNSIYEKSDSKTDKYTKTSSGYGAFYSDFNDALTALYKDWDTVETVKNIQSNQKSVKDIMKKLQESPEGLDKCYSTVSDLYEKYKTLTDLAVAPSGNYSGFSTNKNDAISGFMTSYDKLDSQIPEKR